MLLLLMYNYHKTYMHFSSDARDELGLSPLFDLLDELSLPHVPAAVTKNTSDFVLQMAKVKRVLWTDVFFGTYISADPRDSSKNVIVIDLPERENPFPRYVILILQV